MITSRSHRNWPEYNSNPFKIDLKLPPPSTSAGGIVTAPITQNGLMDFVVTGPGHIGLYGHFGGQLWHQEADIRVTTQSELNGLPGDHAPGVQIADIDGDKRLEIIYLDNQGVLHALDGVSGREEWNSNPPCPVECAQWELAAICNLRGFGDRDIILQSTNKNGYRLGRYLQAYSIEDLMMKNYAPLWERHDYFGCAHGGIRLADINQDGRDEVLGGSIITSEGEGLPGVPLTANNESNHIDALFPANIRVDVPGIETVILEHGGENRVFVHNYDQLIWQSHHKHLKPKYAVAGAFGENPSDRFIWCAANSGNSRLPFVFNQVGEVVVDGEETPGYQTDFWKTGVENVSIIHWDGGHQQFACGRSKGASRTACIFNPLTGEIIKKLTDHADRVYVVDVSGDWREEVVIQSGSRLLIFSNEDKNPNPDLTRFWDNPVYERAKMNYCLSCSQ